MSRLYLFFFPVCRLITSSSLSHLVFVVPSTRNIGLLHNSVRSGPLLLEVVKELTIAQRATALYAYVLLGFMEIGRDMCVASESHDDAAITLTHSLVVERIRSRIL